MWICPNCQTQNEGNFCSACGTPFAPPVQETKPAMPDKKNRGILIACLVVSGIGLILIILLLVLLLGQDDFQPTDLQPIKNDSAVAVQTAEPPAEPAVTPGAVAKPDSSKYWFQTDKDAFLAYVKQQLGVPENAPVKAEIGEVVFWEGAGQWIVHVSFTQNGQPAAGASVSPYNGELMCSILNYTAPTPAATKKPSVSYKSYGNSRYGYSIEYPSFLSEVTYSDNGDGAFISSPDETVTLYMYGDHMAEFGTTPTLSELKRQYKSYAEYVVSYEPVGDNWFVLSGDAGNTVYYEKHILKSDGTHNSFCISYPKSGEKEFDPIITHMVKTFKTGVGADSPSAY